MIRNYIDRAKNELSAAGALKRLSEDAESKADFSIGPEETFYSSVISHSYFAIFYAAKAVLLSKGVETRAPSVHKRTYDAFKEKLVDTGILDLRLLEIYRKTAVRADSLLCIFKSEKRKRGDFTYSTIPQANTGPAEESMQNAKLFVSNIIKVLDGSPEGPA